MRLCGAAQQQGSHTTPTYYLPLYTPHYTPHALPHPTLPLHTPPAPPHLPTAHTHPDPCPPPHTIWHTPYHSSGLGPPLPHTTYQLRRLPSHPTHQLPCLFGCGMVKGELQYTLPFMQDGKLVASKNMKTLLIIVTDRPSSLCGTCPSIVLGRGPLRCYTTTIYPYPGYRLVPARPYLACDAFAVANCATYLFFSAHPTHTNTTTPATQLLVQIHRWTGPGRESHAAVASYLYAWPLRTCQLPATHPLYRGLPLGLVGRSCSIAAFGLGSGLVRAHSNCSR